MAASLNELACRCNPPVGAEVEDRIGERRHHARGSRLADPARRLQALHKGDIDPRHLVGTGANIVASHSPIRATRIFHSGSDVYQLSHAVRGRTYSGIPRFDAANGRVSGGREGDAAMFREVAFRSVAFSACLSALVSASHAQTTTNSSTAQPAVEDRSIRAFKVEIPQAALDDLRQRIAATRWPDKETVTDRSQGAQLARLQALVRYWGRATTGVRPKRS